MNKVYTRINWENYPSENTALDEINLNKMDAALNEVDNRVVAHETTKLDKATANSMVKNLSFNERTGIFTVTYLNGSTKELDTKLEKIATNFVYDEERQKLILTLIDGTTQEIDMSALITQYEFENSAYISFSVASGKVKAEIINGSITADKLQPNFLADVTLQANSAKTSEQNAKVSEENAKQSEINAKNYADSAEPVASTAQGLNPTLENSTGAPIISFKGDGATEQQTYSGKNKLPIAISDSSQNGISYTVDKVNGVITLNGTATEDTPISITTNSNSGNFLDLNTEYIVSFGEEVASDENVVMAVGYRKIGGSSYEYPVYSFRSKEVKFTLAEEYEALIVRVRVASGTTVSNLKVYPMIRLATEEDNTFEKYVGGVASPNPSYPQEIYGVGESGSVEVVSCGKNLLENKGEYKNAAGVTWVINEDGSVTVNGTATTTAFVGLNGTRDFPPTMKKGVEYIVSGGVENVALRIYERKNDGEELILYSASSSRSFKYTIADDVTAVHFRFYATIGVAIKNLTLYPMVRLATVEDDTWEPYTETTANIPLSSPLYDGDYIRYNMDGSGELVRKNYEYIVDRNSYTVKMGYGNNYAMVYLPFNGVSSGAGTTPEENARCTHFVGAVRSKIYYAEVSEGIVISSDGSFAMVRINGYTTLDEYNAWFDSVECKIVYKLAEPTVTPLTAEQIAEFEKLRSFDGVTHVTCEAESEIQYFYDSVGGKAVAMVASKANTSAELPIGSVIMIEEQNTEKPKYGTWYYLFTQTIDGEEGGAPRAVSVKLYQRAE